MDSKTRKIWDLAEAVTNAYLRRIPLRYRNMHHDDLLGAALIGAVEAAQRFHGDFNNLDEWHRYGWKRTRGALIDSCRGMYVNQRQYRKMKDAGTSSDLRPTSLSAFDSERILFAVPDFSEELVQGSFERWLVWYLVDRLEGQECKVITWHYFEGQSLRICAERLGVTDPRACQIHISALKRMQAWAIECEAIAS